jgi:Predicted amidophosphoribosyltransferases
MGNRKKLRGLPKAMSEIICPICNNQSPEQALYCQQCGQPIRCKDCRSALSPTAYFCIQCGKPVSERVSNDQPRQGIGIGVVPSGYNQLKLHETPEVRDIDLVLSNESIQHIGDLFPALFAAHLKGRCSNHTDQQTQQPDVVEIMPNASSQPQLPAAVPQPANTSNDPQENFIWKILKNRMKSLSWI